MTCCGLLGVDRESGFETKEGWRHHRQDLVSETSLDKNRNMAHHRISRHSKMAKWQDTTNNEMRTARNRNTIVLAGALESWRVARGKARVLECWS